VVVKAVGRVAGRAAVGWEGAMAEMAGSVDAVGVAGRVAAKEVWVATLAGEAVAEAVVEAEMEAAVWGEEIVAVLVAAVLAAAAAKAAMGGTPCMGRSRVGGRKQIPEL
jgi:hypothetical protein